MNSEGGGIKQSDSKTVTIKVRNIKVIVALVIIAVVGVFSTYFLMSEISSRTISDYIQDGYMVTYTLNGFGSKLSVVIASTNDYMYVKIVVDGQAVYDKNNIYQVNFQHSMGFGSHTVQIIIQNPSLLGLGATIQVSGKASISLW